MKSEYKVISGIIEKNSRVLDVGCNDGTLMEFLKNNKEKDLAGLISFFDGRVSLPRNSPPLVKHRETFKPKVGDFYIFPAFLMHEVHPFRGEGERRCFSFNAFVDA